MPGTIYKPFNDQQPLATMTARQVCTEKDDRETEVNALELPFQQENKYMSENNLFSAAKWQVCRSLAEEKHLSTKIMTKVFNLGRGAQYWSH